MKQVIRTIDAHAGGLPVRLLVDGVATGGGRSLAARTDRFRRQFDHARRALVRPPRGHDGLVAAVLSEPLTPGAHAAVIFMDAEGYPSLNGEAMMAVATIAIERGVIVTNEPGPEARLTFDTPAGTVTVQLRVEERAGDVRVDSVTLTNVPAFVQAAAHAVRTATRDLHVDIAFGGVFHAILDTEALGIPLDASRLPDVRRMAVDILRALNASGGVQHPADGTMMPVAALTITAAARDPEAHLRNLTIGADGALDPSASTTGTSAAMAVLDAMGLLLDDQPFVHEGIIGSLLRGRMLRRTQVGDVPAVITAITGSAWITGEHTFVLDEDDPFRDGYVV